MGRASPLHPELRRAAIIAATEKLIVAQGGAVSTRAIAEAAGIAEGTIFRVFPTKDAIIDAIFEDAFNREGFTAQLATIDMNLDLRGRMTAVAAILQRRISRIMALFTALGFRSPPSMEKRHKADRHEQSEEIAAILDPDRDELRLPPIEAARLLQGMVMAQSSPMLRGQSGESITPETIVDVILHGVARHPAAP